MDRDLINVLVGFAAIAAVAIPICLKLDKFQKKRQRKHEKILVNKLKNLEVDPTKTVKYLPSPQKMISLFLISSVFVLIGVWMIFEGETLAWIVIAFFGLGLILPIVQFLPGSSYLILSPDGFKYRNFYREFSYSWHEIEDIGPGSIGSSMILFNFSDDYDKQKSARKISKAIAGVEGGLPDTYGMPVSDLAEIMETYRSFNIEGSDKTTDHLLIPLANNASGRIELLDEVVKYKSRDYGAWELFLSEIKVIGEYTNQNGPFADDYFYVFITNLEKWHEASFYADGRDVFFGKLGAKLNQELHGTLVASADFNSNIIWPPSLAGKEMFEFRKEGWFGKLGLANKQYFSQEVIDFVRQ